MLFGRTQQLQDLQQIIQEMSKEIMWVNDREEEELVFDWGDKNIDEYIPRKQESYSVSKTVLNKWEPGEKLIHFDATEIMFKFSYSSRLTFLANLRVLTTLTSFYEGNLHLIREQSSVIN